MIHRAGWVYVTKVPNRPKYAIITAMDAIVATSSYRVKTASFEGPLDLLLNLVEGRKLFINEISLGAVTDEYLAYARALPNHDLSELTSFVSIASTLILIKSRSLLPGFVVTEEEEKDIKTLESRLALYALIRDISIELQGTYGTKIIHLPIDRSQTMSVFAPDPNLQLTDLTIAVRDVLAKVPKEEILPEVRVRKIISIDEMISKLSERIASAASISFRAWQSSIGGEDAGSMKGNVIVSFLAMLELVRQGCMDALQGEAFEDIELTALAQQPHEEIL